MSVDAYDLQILDLLQRDNRISQRSISEAVHLSPSAVNRRIAAMEAAGIIRANVALVDQAKVGRPISIVVEVSVESEQIDRLDKMKARFVGCPAVQQVYYVTGETDFVLILSVADMAEYDVLTRELFFADRNVKHFRTMVVMNRAKVSLEVQIA